MKFGVVSLGNHAINRVVPAIVSSGNQITAVYSTNQNKASEKDIIHQTTLDLKHLNFRSIYSF